jgi:hypothetical protein
MTDLEMNPLLLDEYRVHFVNRRMTPEEEKETSEFIKANRKKLEERELRKQKTLKSSIRAAIQRAAK